MNQHPVNKKEAKQPDLLTVELKKGFQWTTSHSKVVLVFVALFVVGGVSYSFVQYQTFKAEEKASSEYSLVEKDYQKKKEELTKAEKNAQQDMEKDYGSILAGFQKIIDKNPNTKSAIMAALSMNEIYLKYQKTEAALQNIQRVKIGADSLSALLLSQKGTVQANMNDCKSALETWTQILNNKSAQFIHSEALLKQALCYEKLEDKKKAEETYNRVIAEAKDGTLAKSAEKYLRILKSTIK